MLKYILFAAIFIVWTFSIPIETSDDADEPYEGKIGCGKENYTTPTGVVTLQLTNLSTHFCIFPIFPLPPKGKTVTSITLLFSELFLDEHDIVTIYENVESVNDSISLTPPITGQDGALPVYIEKTSAVIKLVGNNTHFIRSFHVMYEAVFGDCSISVPYGVSILHSPIYETNATKEIECSFYFLKDKSHRAIEAFTFEEFNFTESTLTMDNTAPITEYKIDSHMDFFRDSTLTSPVKLHIKLKLNSTEHFKLLINYVDSECSGVEKFNEKLDLKSPSSILNNGSVVFECRWLLQTDSGKVVGLKLDDLNFTDVFDIVAANDGASKMSKPLLQITTSNAQQIKSQAIRSSGRYMWLSFKPTSYASKFSAISSGHSVGGYFVKNGTIKMNAAKDDDVILLEVDQGEVVLLNFSSSEFSGSGATLNIYDGFDTSNLIASLQSKVQYPILSGSSRMMIKPVKFLSSTFVAAFKGVSPGCLHMSTLSSGTYILPRNCSTTCTWIIPPQQMATAILLEIEYLKLNKEDTIEIFQLDSDQTHLGSVLFNQSHVPTLTVPANIGALIEVHQAACVKTEDTSPVFVGSSSYIPGCGFTESPVSSSELLLSSPRYPDTYPVFSVCRWNISSSKGALLHASLHTLSLAPNHCLKIMQNELDSGSSLPADYFVKGNFIVELDTKNCSKQHIDKVLKADKGFLMNITIADCGDVLTKSSGEFQISLKEKQKTCIWKVAVPPTEGKSVNIITYTVTLKEEKKNYDFTVYDGDSVRESEIANISGVIWSRTNTLIFIYKRLNVSLPSTNLTVKYNMLSCNESMQCGNHLCMHPNWRCNGIDECGDASDETNCGAVPIPDENKLEGYSAIAFWVTSLIFLVFGLIAGVFLPVCYRKYRESRYNRFQELSGIDSN